MSVAALAVTPSLPTNALDAASTLDEPSVDPDPDGFYVACGLEDDGTIYLSELVNNRSIARMTVCRANTNAMIAFLRQSGLGYARFIDWHGAQGTKISVHEISLWNDETGEVGDAELTEGICSCLNLLTPPVVTPTRPGGSLAVEVVARGLTTTLSKQAEQTLPDFSPTETRTEEEPGIVPPRLADNTELASINLRSVIIETAKTAVPPLTKKRRTVP